MTACVHYANRLSVVFPLLFGSEWQVDAFGNWQTVHVGSQTDRRAWLTTFQNSDHTGLGNFGSNFESQATQVLLNVIGGFEFAIPELGILMQVTSPFNHLWQDSLSGSVDLFTRLNCRDAYRRGETEEKNKDQIFHGVTFNCRRQGRFVN